MKNAFFMFFISVIKTRFYVFLFLGGTTFLTSMTQGINSEPSHNEVGIKVSLKHVEWSVDTSQ